MTKVTDGLKKVLSNTYLLYLKTQNYHWNVTGGPYFKTLHELFEVNYQELAAAIDEIAERIRQLGDKSPASFSEFNTYAVIKEGNSSKSAEGMLTDLAADQAIMAKLIHEVIDITSSVGDDVTEDILIQRHKAHEKAAWFYQSSLE